MASASTATYQQPVGALELLVIDLWPDYDRASVLVLITGNLPADTPLPAQVTLPLPQNATLNAVARITDEGDMIDDVDYENDSGTVTLTTPDRRFRVEYYLPYTSTGLEREFSFNWPGGPAVAQLDLSVQQPRAATAMNLQPEPETVITGSDGLQYHNLPVRQLEVAESFTVRGSYQLSSEQLTASSAASPEVQDASGGAALSFNWSTALAIAGAVLLLAAVAWQLFGARLREDRRAPLKPRPARAVQTDSGRARYCHQCGAKARNDDRFCRDCGTQLKNT